MTFPERLRQARKDAKMTQKQLQHISGLGESMIGKYERGEVDPTGFALCCLADALKVSTDYLLGRTDKK